MDVQANGNNAPTNVEGVPYNTWVAVQGRLQTALGRQYMRPLYGMEAYESIDEDIDNLVSSLDVRRALEGVPNIAGFQVRFRQNQCRHKHRGYHWLLGLSSTTLNSLGAAESIEELSPDVLFADDLADLQLALPDWDADPDSLLYKALVRISLRHYVARERRNDNTRRSYLYYAEGNDVDHNVAIVGIRRNTGETDDHLKDRVPLAFQGVAVGTIPGVVSAAYRSAEYISDVQALERNDRQTIDVWALGEEGVDLTTPEQTTLGLYLNNPSRKYIGEVVIIGNVTHTNYTIEAAISYDQNLMCCCWRIRLEHPYIPS